MQVKGNKRDEKSQKQDDNILLTLKEGIKLTSHTKSTSLTITGAKLIKKQRVVNVATLNGCWHWLPMKTFIQLQMGLSKMSQFKLEAFTIAPPHNFYTMSQNEKAIVPMSLGNSLFQIWGRKPSLHNHSKAHEIHESSRK